MLKKNMWPDRNRRALSTELEPRNILLPPAAFILSGDEVARSDREIDSLQYFGSGVVVAGQWGLQILLRTQSFLQLISGKQCVRCLVVEHGLEVADRAGLYGDLFLTLLDWKPIAELYQVKIKIE